MGDYAIELKGISKGYETFQLKDINLMIPRGCITGLIGANGAGKSTTIKLILDMIKKDSGEIEIFGQCHNDNTLKERIGVVLDEVHFPEVLNLRDVNRIMKHVYKRWDEKMFFDYAEQFKLHHKKAFKEYSRGMKMKLGLAVALSHGAELLILDEATSGLDPIIREELLDVFMTFVQDERHSILMSSHIISDLEKVCDYIAFMHEGDLIFFEQKDDLIESHRLYKCSEEALKALPPEAIIGYRKHLYGVEVLVRDHENIQNGVVDRASIEDIMLFHTKEKTVC